MRCVGWCVAGGSDVSDDVTTFDRLSLVQAARISIEVGIIVGESSVGVGGPYDVAAERVGADSCDDAVISGKDDRSSWRQNVDSFMPTSRVARRVVGIRDL